MKKTLGLALCLLFLLSLAACGSGSPETTVPTFTGTAPIETAQPETTAAETEPAVTTVPASPTQPEPTDPVQAKETNLIELAGYENLHHYEDTTEEYSMEVLITAATAVSDFRYLEVSYDGEGYDIITTLYSIEELTSDAPFSANVSFPGLFPNRAISFVDYTGAVRYYALTLSGEDGSVLMEEFIQ